MAKCPMCNSKKGKRVCKLVENQSAWVDYFIKNG